MKNNFLFSDKDKALFNKKGIDIEQINSQLICFQKEFLPTKLVKPAILEDGIIAFSKKQQQYFVTEFDECIKFYKVSKFVPASGAATRMFKDLFEAKDNIEKKQKISKKAEHFFSKIKKFAFYEILKDFLKTKNVDFEKEIKNLNYAVILDALLDKNSLNLANKPKAFIPFHKYKKTHRTALEEQIHEGLTFAVGYNDILDIHFTIPQGQVAEYKKNLNKALCEIGDKAKIKASYSYQNKNTDTIAANIDGTPARDNKGCLIFRPAGHGAILQNLNNIKAEMVFIKNIDNIAAEKFQYDTTWHKKVIGGYLMSIVNDLHAFLVMLDDGNVCEHDLSEMMKFATEKLNIKIPEWLIESDNIEKIDYLYEVFNRPIRVCGMVKNEGEPGGGPFYVEDEFGNITLQIVESSQVDKQDSKQQKIFSSGTHFNPVDIVCWKNDFKNKPFNLFDFSDTNAGFIAKKSIDGKDILALELPGLWNGSMAHWITIFVEVPLSTFNPVKEVNDLLREKHIA